MEQNLNPCVRKKITLCATVSPYIAEKVDVLVEEKKFSSVSDLVGVALAEFLVKFPDFEGMKA